MVFALWSTPLIIPLKILIVFLHEISHALAIWLTVVRGGNAFLIYSAGYIGSLLIGMALFLIALRSDLDRKLMGLLGVLTLVITALYIREWFAISFCIGLGLAMLGMARFLPHNVNDLVLRVIGLSSLIIPFMWPRSR